MKRYLTPLLCGLVGLSARAQTTVPAPETQIRLATLAAPADKRDGAAVYGYNTNKEFVLLRKGSNDYICLADDPAQKGFSASCYYQGLEPFMARGRELKKAGKTGAEILAIREQEVKAGKWQMPKQPATLFVYSAPDSSYNTASGDVKNGYLRYVVYIPYATAESTGLPLKAEAPGMPWLMDPGTHRAHIMINPPVTK